MYHMAIPIPEHRLKVEWVITLYNRQMESLFAAARAKAFGLVAPSKILLWP